MHSEQWAELLMSSLLPKKKESFSIQQITVGQGK
uniref:Uncharacterized protein n=1 Tax=Arundo donax TaxID=35708 RepID=A0A0A8Z5E1_ARUDO